jgi:hypothetical protein
MTDDRTTDDDRDARTDTRSTAVTSDAGAAPFSSRRSENTDATVARTDR